MLNTCEYKYLMLTQNAPHSGHDQLGSAGIKKLLLRFLLASTKV